MSTEDKRLAALRKYHATRPTRTRNKLTEALDRIESGSTIILKPGDKLTKTNVCLEAGVSIHTLLTKDMETKKHRYADVLRRYDRLVIAKRRNKESGDDKDEKIAELRALYSAANQDKLNMALEIDNLGMELLKEREEVERLRSFEEQNASLREELRLAQGPVKLTVVGKGKRNKK
jgi:hypothetical protein